MACTAPGPAAVNPMTCGAAKQMTGANTGTYAGSLHIEDVKGRIS
ncbi:hypothetical protein [Micromonospora sp. DT233]